MRVVPAQVVGVRLVLPHDGHVLQCVEKLLGHGVERLGEGGFKFFVSHAVHGGFLSKVA